MQKEKDEQVEHVESLGIPVMTTVSANEELRKADQQGKAVYPLDDKFNSEIEALAKKIEEIINE